jgi:hypothetical protein
LSKGVLNGSNRLSALLSIKDLDMKCALAVEAAKFGDLELAITICNVCVCFGARLIHANITGNFKKME